MNIIESLIPRLTQIVNSCPPIVSELLNITGGIRENNYVYYARTQTCALIAKNKNFRKNTKLSTLTGNYMSKQNVLFAITQMRRLIKELNALLPETEPLWHQYGMNSPELNKLRTLTYVINLNIKNLSIATKVLSVCEDYGYYSGGKKTKKRKMTKRKLTKQKTKKNNTLTHL